MIRELCTIAIVAGTSAYTVEDRMMKNENMEISDMEYQTIYEAINLAAIDRIETAQEIGKSVNLQKSESGFISKRDFNRLKNDYPSYILVSK